MLRLAADADVNGDIIRGLKRRIAELDLLRAQDSLPQGTPDTDVLTWAAAAGRVLITNDRNTMIGHAIQRASRGEPLPGLIVTTNAQSVGRAIEDIELIARFMSADEVRDQVVVYLPL